MSKQVQTTQTTQTTTELTRLTDEQRARWDEDGYLLLEQALSPEEVARLLGAVARLRDVAAAGPAPAAPAGTAVFNAFNVVEADDAFLDVMDHPHVLGLVADLVGANIQLLMSQLMVRPPTPTAALGWHHDGPKPLPFPRVDGLAPLVNLKVGVFLTDVSGPDQGNLVVLPGSHRRTRVDLSGSLAHSAAETTEVLSDAAAAVPVLARPGDVILFHNALWHAVAKSVVDRVRTVLYYTYGPLWLRLGDRDAPSPALATRCGPVRRQLLGALARPEDHGGMHPGPAGTPLLGVLYSRSYTEVMEEEFRREVSS